MWLFPILTIKIRSETSVTRSDIHFQMLNPLICGTFHPEDDDDDEAYWSTSSTTRRSRRGRDSKNPYSSRGLDKFSALLADLEEKRQQIYSQVGSQDISFVRFAYSNSNDCVPIVVKLRDKKLENIKDNNVTHHSAQVVDDKFPIEAGAAANEFKQSGLETDVNTKKKTPFSWKIWVGNWRQPSYYLPAIIIFILFLLTVFGRSVAILCTCLGWYLVPAIKGGSSLDTKKPTKKKEYVRRKSDKMVVSDGSSSPKTNKTRAVNVTSPGQHGHRKSWWPDSSFSLFYFFFFLYALNFWV